jgi:hypothetical protein
LVDIVGRVCAIQINRVGIVKSVSVGTSTQSESADQQGEFNKVFHGYVPLFLCVLVSAA